MDRSAFESGAPEPLPRPRQHAIAWACVVGPGWFSPWVRLNEPVRRALGEVEYGGVCHEDLTEWAMVVGPWLSALGICMGCALPGREERLLRVATPRYRQPMEGAEAIRTGSIAVGAVWVPLISLVLVLVLVLGLVLDPGAQGAVCHCPSPSARYRAPFRSVHRPVLSPVPTVEAIVGSLRRTQVGSQH